MWFLNVHTMLIKYVEDNTVSWCDIHLAAFEGLYILYKYIVG